MKFKLSDQTLAILKYAAQKKVLMFSPQSPEKDHSFFKDLNIQMNREGFYSEDITGFWNPSSFKEYILCNYTNFKEAYEEFGLWRAFRFLSLLTPWSGWAWVLNSTECIASELVDEKIRAIKNPKEKDLAYKQYDQLCKEVPYEDILDYLNKNFLKVNDHMWVAENDPSVIYYDPKFKPYKLKDGWSKEQLGEILKEWAYSVGNIKVNAKFIENAPW